MSDLHNTLDSAVGTFVALMLMEALIKPSATRLGKYILRKADEKVLWIPDFLYKKSDG